MDELDLINKKIGNSFKKADKLNAKYIIIIGTDEVNNKILTIKNNETKEEYKIEEDKLIDFFDEKIEGQYEKKQCKF